MSTAPAFDPSQPRPSTSSDPMSSGQDTTNLDDHSSSSSSRPQLRPSTLSIDRSVPTNNTEYLSQLSPEECLNLFFSQIGPKNDFETFRAAVNAANLNDLMFLSKCVYQSFKQNLHFDHDNTTIFNKDDISYQVLMNNVPMTIKEWSEFTAKAKSSVIIDANGLYVCQCLDCTSSNDKITSQHPIVIYNHIVDRAGIIFKCIECASTISYERPLSDHRCSRDNSSIVLR